MFGRALRELAFAASFFFALSGAQAASLFVQIPGITGAESLPGFPGAMAVQSITVTPQHFVIVKNLDSASPAITAAVVSGTIFPSAFSLLYNSTPTGPPDGTLSFANVIANSHQILGGGATEQDGFVATNPASIFLQLPGITGESSTPGHPGVMQLDSFSLTANQFSIIKPIDSASPAIALAVTTGTVFATSSALFYNSTSPAGLLDGSFTFGNVVASARQILNGGAVPEEQDTFNFVSVVAAVPDSGSTLGLLSLSLIALFCPRRFYRVRPV